MTNYARLLLAGGLVCECLLAWSCAKQTTEFRIGEPISMGPFTIAVESVEESETGRHPSEGPLPDIRVYYRMVDNQARPFSETVDHFFLNSHLEDRAGNRIEYSGCAFVEGDRHHPVEWFTEFEVDPTRMGIRDRDKLGRQASDFTLVIDNPEVRRGQPERALVPLG